MDSELRRRAIRGVLRASLACAAVALAFGATTILRQDAPSGISEQQVEHDFELVFAGTHEYWSAPTIVAQRLGLYGDVGLRVDIANFQSGIDAKNAVLNGTADVGVVATAPMAIAAFQGEALKLIATVFQDNRIVKLVARGAADGEVSPTDLVGRRVGYVPGTISERVLEAMLDQYGVPNSAVTTATFRPSALLPAMAGDHIDAFVAWEPLPLLARKAVPDAQEFVDPDLYTVSLHIVTRPDVIDAKPAALTAFLRALQRAVSEIDGDSDATRRLVEATLDFDVDELEAVWSGLSFMVAFDEAELLAALRADGNWARRAGYVRGNDPAYDALLDARIHAALTSQADR